MSAFDHLIPDDHVGIEPSDPEIVARVLAQFRESAIWTREQMHRDMMLFFDTRTPVQRKRDANRERYRRHYARGKR